MPTRAGLWRAADVVLVVLAVVIDLLVWGGDRDLRGGGQVPFWVVPILTGVVFSVLLVRRQHPVIAFWVQWTYALADLLIPRYEPFMGLLVALHMVARRASPRTAQAALCACAVPFGIDSYNLTAREPGGHELAQFATSVLVWALVSGTVWGLGRLGYLADAREERLRQAHLADAAAAVQAERLHLARELHDIVSHTVSAMILQAAGARTLVRPRDERLRQSLTTIETAGVQAMVELHRLLGLLRSVDPAATDAVYEFQPSLNDLAPLIEVSRSAGLAVEFLVDGQASDLDASVDLAAYRIIQESLTNTAKHAGQGASARVHLRWHSEGLTITVRDSAGLRRHSGVKPQALSSGRGLIGLAERVTLVGGHLESGAVNGGFLVRADLPLSTIARPLESGTPSRGQG